MVMTMAMTMTGKSFVGCFVFSPCIYYIRRDKHVRTVSGVVSHRLNHIGLAGNVYRIGKNMAREVDGHKTLRNGLGAEPELGLRW